MRRPRMAAGVRKRYGDKHDGPFRRLCEFLIIRAGSQSYRHGHFGISSRTWPSPPCSSSSGGRTAPMAVHDGSRRAGARRRQLAVRPHPAAAAAAAARRTERGGRASAADGVVVPSHGDDVVRWTMVGQVWVLLGRGRATGSDSGAWVRGLKLHLYYLLFISNKKQSPLISC